MIKELTKMSNKIEDGYNDGASLQVAQVLFGVSGYELSRELGVTAQAISGFKRSRKFNKERLEKLAEFFGMTVESFRDLNKRALTEAIDREMEDLVHHLEDRFPGDQAKIKRLAKHFQKVVDLVAEIEGVA